HLALGSQVAVKVLRPGVPETAHIRRKRFVREARVAARIQSDHVVRVFDIVAPDEGLIYIVMELLNGETLADRIKREGAMPPAEAVDYMLQAAKPLAQMHDAGIVHRDVKPSNIFLARDADGNERLKLLDFGVAAFQQPLARGESSITLTDAIIGTPRYMAPEQVRASKEVDARADVWALGVTLYELLAGSPPFAGQTVLAVLNQIEQQEPPLLSARQPRVTTELAAVVHRCLAKDPALRPADARALAEALAPFAKQSSLAADAPVRRPSDPVDLSLSDENVEVVRPAPPSTPRARLSMLLGRRGLTAAAAAAAIAFAATAVFALHGREKTPTPDEVKTNPESSPAALVAETSASATAAEPSSASSPPLVTTEPIRDGATAHRAVEPARPAGAPKKSGKASPHPATNKAARSPAEDDDRIE
ncbi:MAG: serine/threonine-protein kinase, partial [Polyangiaceae bacterium]